MVVVLSFLSKLIVEMEYKFSIVRYHTKVPKVL